MIATLLTAFLLGLAGSSHCVGMCGGISCALGLAGRPTALTALLYQLGRLLSYGAIALLLGSVVMQLQTAAPQLALWLRTVAGVLLIMMALYSLRWWQGITVLETAGGKLWRPLQRKLLPLLPANGYARALCMGLVWGWLPCALVYSTLAWAVTQSSSAWQASGLMLVFGLGTAPAMLAAGIFAQQLKKLQQQLQFRRVLGVLLLAMGAWTLWGVWQHAAGHGDHANHGHHHAVTPTGEPDKQIPPQAHSHHNSSSPSAQQQTDMPVSQPAKPSRDHSAHHH